MARPFAELPSVDWLTDDQLAAVNLSEMVGRNELLRSAGCHDPWLVKLREALLAQIETLATSSGALIRRTQQLAHNLERPIDLRHHSEVAHHLSFSFEDVVARLGDADPIVEQVGRVELRCRPGQVTVRPVRFEAEGSLRLPASYPELPIRLAVEPWWRDRCVVGISLRSNRRLRYPRRYFPAAHRVLSQLAADTGLDGRSNAGGVAVSA